MEIGRNSIIIRNIDQESDSYKKLYRRFSLYDTVSHKYVYSAFKIINGDAFFPASIGKNVIKSYLGKDEEEIYVFNNSAKATKIDFILKHQPRDELQEKAIKFLLKMKKDKNRERLISLETGKGKTYVTINFISQLKEKAMVVVDNLSLAGQWKEEFLKHTDLKKEDIVILSGKESITKEKKLQEESRGKIYIAIHRTLSNIIEENFKNIDLLMKDLGIGIRIFDECHVEYKNICQISALSNVNYTIFLSATPSRSNYNDDSLYGKIFRNIPYFNGKELEKDKYHTVIISEFDSKPDLSTKLKIKTKYGFSIPRWSDYIEDEGYEFFIENLENLINKLELKRRNKKTFIMLPKISLIEKVKQSLKDDLGIDCGTFIGSIKVNEREQQLKYVFVLTNEKIFDKGIDVQDLEVLINCVPMGSLVKTEQIIGRLRYKEGKSSILIDVTDTGFSETVAQQKQRKKFYKNKCKKIINLN